jgi:hypothetical protein
VKYKIIKAGDKYIGKITSFWFDGWGRHVDANGRLWMDMQYAVQLGANSEEEAEAATREAIEEHLIKKGRVANTQVVKKGSF